MDPEMLPDIAARLRATAAARPDHPAVVVGDRSVTYRELHERVGASTAALQELGIGPGDRVGLVLGNGLTFVELYAAVLRCGAAFVPLLTGLAPDELRHALRDARAVAVAVGPERASDIAAVAADLPELVHVIFAGGPEGAVPEAKRVHDYEALVAAAGEPRRVERAPADLAALVYTSGTTGRPRGAMLTRGNLSTNQEQSLAGRFRVGPDDIVLLVLPLAHIYALNVGLGTSIAVGATMVVVDRFDPLETLQLIAGHRVTVLLGAPPLYVAWLQSGQLPETDLSSVRLAVSGAAPLGVSTIELFASVTGITIEEGYGLTEASPSVAATSMASRPLPGSIGHPLPGIDVRLVGDDGADVVRGDPGELWVRGPNVFQGYWDDPDATARALTSDGWLRTGDLATQGDEGELYLVGRLRDLVIVNGFNVYPEEVERVPFVPKECEPDMSLQKRSREESLPHRSVYVELAT
jgi:long-chain acyl-CoA synthetase